MIETKMKFSHILAMTVTGGFAACPAAAPLAATAPEQGSPWLTRFHETTQGNVIMGNPDAPVKLIEYASYTCGHCAAFETTEAPRLEQEDIAGGRVNFEMRSLVRDPVDLTLAMLARCGGKDLFFGTHRLFMTNQSAILQKTSAITPATAEKLKNRDLVGFMTGIYDEMKLGEWMQRRGIADDRAKQCLANEPALTNLLKISSEAGPAYNIQGTPSFIINEKLAAGAHDYNSLRPLLAASNSTK